MARCAPKCEKTVQALLCRNRNVKSSTLPNATSSRRIRLQDDLVTGFHFSKSGSNTKTSRTQTSIYTSTGLRSVSSGSILRTPRPGLVTFDPHKYDNLSFTRQGTGIGLNKLQPSIRLPREQEARKWTEVFPVGRLGGEAGGGSGEESGQCIIEKGDWERAGLELPVRAHRIERIPLNAILIVPCDDDVELTAEKDSAFRRAARWCEGAKSIGVRAATIALAGAAIGIGNIFSSLIHSVARNPSLAKQLFGYAILGFALTEAIALFALMMAFLILSVFQIKNRVYISNIPRGRTKEGKLQNWTVKAREVDNKQQATASQPPNLSISQALTSKKTDVLTSERSIRNEALEQWLSAQSVACCPFL
ncbi:hypothetical protein AgCh_025074 [Apium graveolens]